MAWKNENLAIAHFIIVEAIGKADPLDKKMLVDTALIFAILTNNLKLVKFVIAQGTSLNVRLRCTTNDSLMSWTGQTPSDPTYSQDPRPHSFLNIPLPFLQEVFPYIKENKVDIDAMDPLKYGPKETNRKYLNIVYLASLASSYYDDSSIFEAILKQLRNEGIDVDLQDNLYQNPYARANANGNLKQKELLKKYQANVMPVSKDDRLSLLISFLLKQSRKSDTRGGCLIR